MTPHIEAQPGDYADTVLLPGDPLRAKWIAETFVSASKRTTAVQKSPLPRGAFGGNVEFVVSYAVDNDGSVRPVCEWREAI